VLNIELILPGKEVGVTKAYNREAKRGPLTI